MKSKKHYRKDFLNYLEGTLSQDELAHFEAALAESQELQGELAEYRRIVQMEQKIAKEDFQLDERFVSKVMAEIKHQPSLFGRLFMQFKNPTRAWTAGFGSLAVVTLCVALVYGPEYRTYEKRMNQPEGTAEESPAKVPVADAGKDSAKKQENQPELLTPESSTAATSDKDSARLVDENQDTREVPAAKVRTAPELLIMDKRGTTQRAKEAELDSHLGQGAAASADQSIGIAPLQKPTDQLEVMEGVAGRNLIGGITGAEKIAGQVSPAPGIYAPPSYSDYSRRNWNQYTNTERYQSQTENAPVLTSVEPMSTFSIDVDTGSYTNARRFLQAGQFPPSDSVRIEEFLNYFDYDYPTAGSEPFAANFEVAPTLERDGKYLLKIGIKAKDSAALDSEKPWNLVFLVDVSGSMQSADKLQLVQRSLELLTNKMRPGDRVSLVTYAGYSGVVLPPTGIENKAQIITAIQSLSSGGSTHGSAGIQQAYLTAQQAFIPGGVNRVILATDGDFNVGVVNNDELIKLIEEKRRSGITLTTLGFGTGNYNEAMMEQLANKGNGNYFYIDGFQEARKVFETDLFGTIEVVAKDVKLQIEFNPQHVAEYRLVGYENRKLANQDFANDKIDAGEIGAGHTVTALYEIVLVGTEAANRIAPEYRYQTGEKKVARQPESSFGSELAFLKIRYKAPEGSRSALLTFPLKRSSVKDELSKASVDFQFAAAVSAFAHKLRASQYAPELSYKEIANIASNAKGRDEHGYRREFVELVKNAAARAGNER